MHALNAKSGAEATGSPALDFPVASAVAVTRTRTLREVVLITSEPCRCLLRVFVRNEKTSARPSRRGPRSRAASNQEPLELVFQEQTACGGARSASAAADGAADGLEGERSVAAPPRTRRSVSSEELAWLHQLAAVSERSEQPRPVFRARAASAPLATALLSLRWTPALVMRQEQVLLVFSLVRSRLSFSLSVRASLLFLLLRAPTVARFQSTPSPTRLHHRLSRAAPCAHRPLPLLHRTLCVRTAATQRHRSCTATPRRSSKRSKSRSSAGSTSQTWMKGGSVKLIVRR